MAALPLIVRSVELTNRCLGEVSLPSVISHVISILHIGRLFSRNWTRILLRFENPKLFLSGMILNECIGQFAFVRIAVKILVISRILFDVAETTVVISKNIKHILNCVVCRQRHKYTQDIDRGLKVEEGSRSSYACLPQPTVSTAVALTCLTQRIYELVFQIWSLAGSLCDLAEAVWNDSSEDSVSDIFIECQRIAEVSGGIIGLPQLICSHKEKISTIFRYLNITLSVEEVAKKISYITSSRLFGYMARSSTKNAPSIQMNKVLSML
jgi:hypothetical protein